MRRTGIVYNDRYLKHDTGYGHPEKAERLNAIINKLKSEKIFAKLSKIEESTASLDCIEKNHSLSYIKRAEKSIESGVRYLDSIDTNVCPDSYEIALYAAGAGLSAADYIMSGKIDNAFCCIRPPGHHAEYDHAMGFCIFNNMAILARYLQDKYFIKKIFIVDWDLHHGNGTQNSFYDNPDVFYVSLHQYPLYPGTGNVNERGIGNGTGFTLNIPLSAGSGNEEYLNAFKQYIIPEAHKFVPDFILVSAGYDAHHRDPLGSMRLSSEAYKEFTSMLMDIADEYSNGRIIALLEGGYDLTGLSESVFYTIDTLLNK